MGAGTAQRARLAPDPELLFINALPQVGGLSEGGSVRMAEHTCPVRDRET